MSPELSTARAVAPAKRPPSRLFIAVIVAVPLLLVVIVALAVRAADQTTRQLGMDSSDQLVMYPTSEQKAPAAVTLKRLGGGAPVELGGAVGHPRVVNFFASWCPACRRELGAIAAVARSSNVSFVGVDTDDSATQTALSLLHQAGATYPVGVGQAPLAEAYGTGNLPTTAFLNSKGRIVGLYLGALTKTELSRLVADLEAGRPL
jgi:cytochrome c biogenesis protein CcmG/thiol:disulfide interchange protein DsbE